MAWTIKTIISKVTFTAVYRLQAWNKHGFIDVGDGCWRPNLLVTDSGCWWVTNLTLSPTSLSPTSITKNMYISWKSQNYSKIVNLRNILWKISTMPPRTKTAVLDRLPLKWTTDQNLGSDMDGSGRRTIKNLKMWTEVDRWTESPSVEAWFWTWDSYEQNSMSWICNISKNLLY